MEERKAGQSSLPLQLLSDSRHTYVVFGKTGAGKSSIINKMQNWKVFKTGCVLQSVTHDVQSVKAPFLGYPTSDVLHIDTPGFMDVDEGEEAILLKLVGFLKHIHNGFNYFFFVISLKETRFDKSIQQSMHNLSKIFGPEVYSYCKIIYSCYDSLKED